MPPPATSPDPKHSGAEVVRLLLPLAREAGLPWWERAGRAALLLSLLIGMAISVNRAYHAQGGTDFPEFHAAGRYVLLHGARHPQTILVNYLPSVDVAWAALGWMPMPVAAAVWYLVNAATWLALLAAIHRYLLAGLAPAYRRHTTLAAGLLVTPLVLDGMCLGAFHVAMVWLTLAGLGRVARGKCWSGGLLLGLAVWIKLLPAVGVAYLVLKRKWLPAAMAVATLLAVDLALCLVAFGPRGTCDTHRSWWLEHASASVGKQLTDREAIDEDRLTNQSAAVVVRRLLSRLGCEFGSPRNWVSLADCSPGQLKLVYGALLGALLAGMAAYCRRPGRELSADQWAGEIALIVLATLWFSPVVWGYHPTAAAPALAVIAAQRRKFPGPVWLVLGLWLAAMASHGSAVACGLGAMLWMSLCLGAVLAWLTAEWPQRRPSAVLALPSARQAACS